MSNSATLDEIQSVIHSEHGQIAAVFDNEAEADKLMHSVQTDTDVKPEQMTLIRPLDDHFSEKLERQSAKIGKSLWHSHLLLGSVGLFIGLVIASMLVMFGPAFTQNNPLFTYIALLSPGLFIGIFVAGLLGLRPDRDKIIQTVRSASRRNKFTVIINLRDGQSSSKIQKLLGPRSDTIVEATQ